MNERKVDRHPVRGVVAGLVLGLGAALLLFVFGVVPMTLLWLALVVVAGAALGLVLAYVVPPRHRVAT